MKQGYQLLTVPCFHEFFILRLKRLKGEDYEIIKKKVEYMLKHPDFSANEK
ncbi:MAG: hypothetical protein GY940_27440 [bacterium]|nr:hypothetical protein [bacterium]